MRTTSQWPFLVAAVASLTSAVVARRSLAQEVAPAGNASLVEVRGGTVTFKVDTNLPAINVHGKSKALAGKVYVRESTNGVLLEKLEASLPVESLDTGLGLRDEHMRKRVFTTSDGQLPDLKFAADTARCSPAAPAGASTCQLAGNLSLRGVARPFTIALKVNEDSGKVRASGDGLVKLSTYGIVRPTNLGVQTADDVILHLEVTAVRPPGRATSEPGGRR
ncbi:MAG: YceI family protein [Vicinamibacterales bacterium]|jgi:polyisoprenoid-binding protein YceI